MKRYFLLALLLTCVLGLQAQKLTVEKMEVAPMDISASTQPRLDKNGNPCALVKVLLPTVGVTFEGNVLGDVAFKAGEYWVYMSEGSYMLNVKHPNFYPLMVNFRDYDIKKVEGKVTYVLTLLLPQTTAEEKKQKLTVNYSPASAIVLIDSKTYQGDGHIEVELPVGSHDYQIAAVGYVTAEGSVKLNEYSSRTITEALVPLSVAGQSSSTVDKETLAKAKQKRVPVVVNGKYGFADYTGRHVIPCQYDTVHRFMAGLAAAKYGGKWGYIDINGKVVIPFVWRKTGYFSEEEQTGTVQDSNGKWGYIDKSGKLTIPCRWDLAVGFVEGRGMVFVNGKGFGFIDTNGKEISECQWRLAGNFHDGLAMVLNDDFMCSFIDKNGEGVFPFFSETVYQFSEGLAVMTDDSTEKQGYIDKKLKRVIPCEWDEANDFSEGLAAVRNDNNRVGFIDKTGRLVIPCKWADGYCFSEGLAFVKNSYGKWGCIDKTGELVIPCQWEGATNFVDGSAWVELTPDNWRLIDKSGKYIE